MSDNQPDHPSNYFPSSSACYEPYPDGLQNPNAIGTQNLSMTIPLTPNTNSEGMSPGGVGMAVNGVMLYDNQAAPGDDIYLEAATFDRCQGHPSQGDRYHYHSEPFSLSYDDDNLIGVMRDGYFVYGRRDLDGSTPMLDDNGGHTGPTEDSSGTPVYHYHLNHQVSTNPGSLGEEAWFITTGVYLGSPGACTGCM